MMAARMRVVHVYKNYHPVIGGIENHVRSLAEEQVRRGYDVTVMAASPGRRGVEQVVGGVRLVLVPRLVTLFSAPVCPTFPFRLRHERADLIHLHFPYPPGEIARLVLGDRIPTVITYHSDIVRQRRLLRVYEPLLRRVLERADRIVVTSPPYLRTSPYLPAVTAKCSVVPLGIDVERFALNGNGHGSARSIRRRWSIPEEAFVVGFVGRMRYYKGLDHLMRAIARVPAARLLLVGDGPLRRVLQRLARSLGVSGRVTFAGEVTDEELPAYYRAADLFALPSTGRAEAFGTSLVEAMAAGLPVISTEVASGTSWVNESGTTGLVVPPCDATALAAAIDRLREDPVLRSRMGAAARRRAAACFRLASMVDGVEEVYRTAGLRAV
jgi:rhamnosyl/mannosyltransferase